MHIEVYTEKMRKRKSNMKLHLASFKENEGLVLFPTAQAPIVQ